MFSYILVPTSRYFHIYLKYFVPVLYGMAPKKIVQITFIVILFDMPFLTVS